ncbi:hypothetical protein [Pedobacter sp. WC2423]
MEKFLTLVWITMWKTKKYVEKVTLNGKILERGWITQEEIMKGGNW